jgi:hypothetical protein
METAMTTASRTVARMMSPIKRAKSPFKTVRHDSMDQSERNAQIATPQKATTKRAKAKRIRGLDSSSGAAR